MAFQTKSFVAIVASMINRVRRTTSLITDFNVGSVWRTLVEAPAQEIDDLYQQMVRALLDAIPVSVYNSFDFSALPPVAAGGLVRVSITPASAVTLISAGSVFSIDGNPASYTSTVDAQIQAGASYVDVPVAASVAGAAGNIPAGQVFNVSPAPSGFVSATNLAAFLNGSDAETDDQRKARFGLFIQSLSRATTAALKYAALTASVTDAGGNVIEQVKSAVVVEAYLQVPPGPTGLVTVYVHNGVGSTSAALVAAAQQIINGYVNAAGQNVPGYKGAGINVVVVAATDQSLDITGVLTVMPGYTTAAVDVSVGAVIAAYAAGLPVGASYQASQAAALVIGVSGVSNWQPASPTADVAAGSNSKILPGVVTVIGTPLAATLSATSTMTATLTA